jgi:hypothetical protein
MSRFVSCKTDARVHVTSLGKCSFDALLKLSSDLPHHDVVAGFAPSGWTWAKVSKKKYRETGVLHTTRAFEKVMAVSLPYSEHSSYSELIDCVAHFRPSTIIPTVHNTGHSKQVFSCSFLFFFFFFVVQIFVETRRLLNNLFLIIHLLT